MYSFAAILGYFILGQDVPDTVITVFRCSSLELKNKDHCVIYSMLKNAPDLNDKLLRQLIIKILGVDNVSI